MYTELHFKDFMFLVLSVLNGHSCSIFINGLEHLQITHQVLTNMKYKTDEACEHHFEFVRTERRPIYSTGADFELVDVVICTKCGKVKRN